jgi:hypothetical protein
MVENAEGIICHVMQRVGNRNRDFLPHHRLHRDFVGLNDNSMMLMRQTAIAVVEQHNVESAVDKHLHELFRPCRELGAKPHNPQEGGM